MLESFPLSRHDNQRIFIGGRALNHHVFRFSLFHDTGDLYSLKQSLPHVDVTSKMRLQDVPDALPSHGIVDHQNDRSCLSRDRSHVGVLGQQSISTGAEHLSLGFVFAF